MKNTHLNFYLFSFATAAVFGGILSDAPRAHAYEIYATPIPAIIRDNGRDFNVNIILGGTSSLVPNEIEGPTVLSAGYNMYIGGYVNNFYDADTANPAPTTIPDVIVNPSTLLEFFALSNIESLTIAGVSYNIPQIMAQNPQLDLERIVLGAVVAIPIGFQVNQGSFGGEFQGNELMFDLQFNISNVSTVVPYSDIESHDIDNDGFSEIIFTTDDAVNVLDQNGNQEFGFPFVLSTLIGSSPVNLQVYGVSVGDVNISSPGSEIVIAYFDSMSPLGNVVIVSSTGTVLANVAIGNPSPNNTLFDGKPLKLADVDMDGIPDIVWIQGTAPVGAIMIDVINGLGAHVSGYPVFSVTAGSTQPGILINVMNSGAGNVDSDPNLEAVIVSAFATPGPGTDYTVTVFDLATGMSQGTFNPPSSTLMNINTVFLLFDSDSDPELEIAFVTTGALGGTLYSLEVFNADGTVVPGWPQAISVFPRSLFAGDIDSDGINEIGVAGTGLSSGIAGAMLFRSNGVLYGNSAFTGTSLSSVRGKILDIDLDGVEEVLIDAETGFSPILNIFEATGANPFSPNIFGPGIVNYNFLLPTSPNTPTLYGSTIADIDGDGVWELAVMQNYSGTSIELKAFKIAYTSGGVPDPTLHKNRSTYVNERNTNALQ